MQVQVPSRIFGRWIYVVGVLLLCVVVVAGSFPGKARWIRVLHDSGHGYVFAIVGVLCLLAWRRMHAKSGTTDWSFVGAWAVATGIGLATEIAQRYTSRDASWSDVGMDAVGAAFGLTVLFAWERWREQKKGVLAAGSVAAILLLAMLRSTLIMMAAYWERTEAFPVIARFDEFYGRYFTYGDSVQTRIETLPPRYSATGERALHVEYEPSEWAMLAFTDFVPDWSGYRTLVIDVINPDDETQPVKVRANDAFYREDDKDEEKLERRFTRRFDLPPHSRQQLRIPLDDIRRSPGHREADLSNMQHIALYRNWADDSQLLLVVKIWLE